MGCRQVRSLYENEANGRKIFPETGYEQNSFFEKSDKL